MLLEALKTKKLLKEDIIIYRFMELAKTSLKNFGIHFYEPGLFLHGRVYLFEYSNYKMSQFNRNSMGQICYFEPSDKIKKKYKNQCSPIIGILEKDSLTKYKILNPLTQEPVNEHSAALNLDDISVCCPVKCEYYPDTITNK